MSLRKLPEIKAFEKPEGLKFEPDPDALTRWAPEIRAAGSDDATITIFEEIGEDFFGDGVSVKRISAALRSIGNRDVTVAINSPGGDFFDGIAIYNLLREHPHKVTVKVVGLAASTASIIAMAGDEVRISDAGFLMIHNAWAVAIGNRHDMREAADMLEPFDDAMASVYAKRSGAEKSEVAAWMDAEKWFNGKQAIAAGLADAILGDDEVEEDTNAKLKSFAAVRRIETMLRTGGMSSKDAKTLIAQARTGERDAADLTVTRDADDIMAGIHRLTSTIGS